MLLESGRVDAAIDMYKSMHKWDAAVAVAELTNHGELEHLRKGYYAWLTETGQVCCCCTAPLPSHHRSLGRRLGSKAEPGTWPCCWRGAVC